PVRSPDAQVTLPVTPVTATLSITKTADTSGSVYVGDTVTYTYTVTNTGGATVSDLAVVDDHAPDVTCDRTTLDPGEAATCHATYTVTEADGDAGHVTNRAHATGTDPRGEPVHSPEVELCLTVVVRPPGGYED
ncbi:DUF7507 domain-containing protein, partial [Kitasatospora putterlickiae]|uniref:DUF7507 domain-containing protein n=1 Tax=Kitasatospora putterlickiae TaxID=221725 RepID=UPI003CD08146